ncbi:MAG: FHA domain-containing protein, partial [Gammaproteobacteria bacterium]
MRILVRYLSQKSKTSDTRQDVPLQGSPLRIGRGTDQDIHLPNLRVALNHAELIDGQDGKIRMQTRLATGFLYNGTTVRGAILSAGDQIDLGGFKIRVGRAAGCDLALEISEDAASRGHETEAALLQRAKLDLRAAGLTKRRWALGLAFGILAAFLLVPLIAALAPGAGHWLRMLPLLPSDHAWSSGKVSDAHAHFGTDCNACHTVPFVPTRNSACLHCHQKTPHHADPETLKLGLFDGARCGACHFEHAGRASISRRDEGLCVRCHAEPKSISPNIKVEAVTDFGTGHPEFRPTLSFALGDKTVTRRTAIGVALREAPGIEFSHLGHLNPAGVAGPRGTVVLGCADCHQVEAGGGRMQPITFERNCHECHQLNIPGDVVREAPHGDPEAARSAIEDYYHAWARRGGYPNLFAPDGVRQRRRPGQPLTRPQPQEALAWDAKTTALSGADM